MVVNRGNENQKAKIVTDDAHRTFLNLQTGQNLGHLEPGQTLQFDIEANGFATILAVVDYEHDPELMDLMAEMRAMSQAGPLSSFSNDWKFLT